MGFLEDVEKGLDWLGGQSGKQDADTEELRKAMAAECKAWADGEIDQMMKLAGSSLPAVAQTMVRTKLTTFAEACYGRGVADAGRVAEASSPK